MGHKAQGTGPIPPIADRAGKLGFVQRAFTATTEATPEKLFEVVGDIGTYPHWLDVVSEVDPTEEGEAWLITLRARVGPFARSKRLRMVRTVHDPADEGKAAVARFERQETDGKEHSNWVLAARVEPTNGDLAGNNGAPDHRSLVTLDLSYEGSMWSGLLDGVLGSAADRATAKLQDYVKTR